MVANTRMQKVLPTIRTQKNESCMRTRRKVETWDVQEFPESAHEEMFRRPFEVKARVVRIQEQGNTWRPTVTEGCEQASFGCSKDCWQPKRTYLPQRRTTLDTASSSEGMGTCADWESMRCRSLAAHLACSRNMLRNSRQTIGSASG